MENKTQIPFITEMRKLGWGYYQTGGGCDAWIKGSEDNNHLLLTVLGGSNIPRGKGDRVGVGLYVVGDGGDLVGNNSIGEVICPFGEILTGKIEINVFNPEEVKT